MLQEGYEFKPGYLYESGKFVLVNLGPSAPAVYKRITKEPN
jgi:hypothetical protein